MPGHDAPDENRRCDTSPEAFSTSPPDGHDPAYTFSTPPYPHEPLHERDSNPATSKGSLLPWLIVIGVVALLVVARPGAEEEPVGDRDLLFEIQARVLVEVSSLPGAPATLLDEQVAELRGRGNVTQRCSSIVLLAELVGLETARDELADLKNVIKERRREGWAPEEHESELVALIDHVYGGGDPRTTVGTLSESERELLVERLGWLGELALVPNGGTAAQRNDVLSSASQTAIILGVVFLGVLASALLGVVALFALMAMSSAGWTQRHFRPAKMRPARSIQIFAVWILLFVGLQLGAGVLAATTSVPASYLNLAAFFASAVALMWPILLGERWSDVRSDLGLHLGRNGFVEGVAGGWGFCMMLPFLFVGAAISAAISAARVPVDSVASGLDPVEIFSHPIVPEALSSSTPERIALFLMATVAAPVIEEIFFRGALYRHLRCVSQRAGTILSIGFSALFGGVLFASIHPQGWVAIPALTGIACGITLLREWRDSVIPCMIVHGLWNGLLFATLFQLL